MSEESYIVQRPAEMPKMLAHVGLLFKVRTDDEGGARFFGIGQAFTGEPVMEWALGPLATIEQIKKWLENGWISRLT